MNICPFAHVSYGDLLNICGHKGQKVLNEIRKICDNLIYKLIMYIKVKK